MDLSITDELGLRAKRGAPFLWLLDAVRAVGSAGGGSNEKFCGCIIPRDLREL